MPKASKKRASRSVTNSSLSKLESSLASQYEQLSYYQKLLRDAYVSSDSSKIYQLTLKTSLLRQQIKKTKFDIESVKYPKQTFSSHTQRRPAFHKIFLGDYLYHKIWGRGIVYSIGTISFKCYFEDKTTHSFTFQDSAFDDKTLILKSHWSKHQGTYIPVIHPAEFLPPIEESKSYSQFLANQTTDLNHSISNLCSSNDAVFLKHYSQCALDSIHNLESSKIVFLSLRQKKSATRDFSPSFPVSTSVEYKSSNDTLYVYTSCIKCIREKHDIVCVNAHIDTASGTTAILNVNRCLNCNRFYISYDEYTHYMEKYKSLLTRIVLVDENGNSNFTSSLALESTLKLCGYSVSQEKGFTSQERAALLSNIIHNHVATKPDVIRHLNWLIHMNGKKAGNDIAREKWEEDLAFVRKLDTETQSNYKVNAVVPYRSAAKRKKY